jgi:MFS family permease
MTEERVSWSTLQNNYEVSYVFKLLITFSFLFFIESNPNTGSFGVVTVILRFGLIFEGNVSDPLFVYVCVGFLGNLIGSTTSVMIANRWGRKKAVLIGCGLFVLGTSIVRSRQDVIDFVVTTVIARLLEGSANGLFTTIIPYICKAYSVNETLPIKSRGTLGVTMQFMWVLGLYCTLVMSLLTFKHSPPSLEVWRYAVLVLICFTVVIAGVISSYFHHFDTVMWLILKDKPDQAREVMRRIHRNPGLVPREAQFWNFESSQTQNTKKPLLLGMSKVHLALAMANLSTGFFFYIFYGGDLIGKSQSSLKHRIVSVIICMSSSVIGSFCAFFFVNRFSRKTLMLIGLIPMGILQYVLGAVVIAELSNDLSLASVSLIIFIYQSTVAPLYWVYAPELMKLDDFGKIQVMYWTLAWMNTVISFVIPGSLSFVIILVFATSSLTLACLVWYFVIETRQVSWPKKYSMMTFVGGEEEAAS